MPTLTQSQSIILGKAIEKCIAPVLDAQKYTYVFSEPYEELLTRPDYLFYENGIPFASMAVTCTQDNQAMNMKRWRYIDEVFQLKSFFGKDLVVINCEFGNHHSYKKSELSLANAFFDASILVYDVENGPEFLYYATALVQEAGATTDSIVENLRKSEYWEKVSNGIATQLSWIFENQTELVNRSPFCNIWDCEHSDFRTKLEIVKKTEYPVVESYLRYCVLGGLIVGNSSMHEILLSAKNGSKISKKTIDACQEAGFIYSSRIGGNVISDEKVIKTVNSGLTYELFLRLEEVLSSNEALKYLIRDLQHDAIVDQMLEVLFEILEKKENLTNELIAAFRSNTYKGIAHNRTWLLDWILVYLNISTNYLNKLYIQEYGTTGIATKLEHYISKTDCGEVVFASNEELQVFCSNLTNIIIRELGLINEIPSKELLRKRFIDKKKVSLGKQPFINPLHRYIESVLEAHHIDYSKESITCALSGLNTIPESMKSIREIYQIKINNELIWVKTIAGYDGVKDKTREMAARARLLQYASLIAEKRNNKMVFVYDGKWTKNLQQLLVLSGWKTLVPVFRFEEYIEEML